MTNRISAAAVAPPSRSQLEQLLWAFDKYGNINADIFLTICEHERIDFSYLSEDERYEMLRWLGLTSFAKSLACPQN